MAVTMPDRSSNARLVFTHQFVAEIPPSMQLREGTLYISMHYATVVHLCACGCGHEVVNPLSPTDWRLTFDGESVSLSPSINNSSLPCASHYWIDRSEICWGEHVSAARVAALRAADQRAKDRFYGNVPIPAPGVAAPPGPRRSGLLAGLFRIWRRRPPG